MLLNNRQLDYASVAIKLSALLGRKFNVRIIFGSHPRTDGSTIHLPHWDMTCPLKRLALYGLIAHEAGGHIRQTDFALLQRAVGKRRLEPNFHVWLSLNNILEDIRIEANLLRDYPGASTYLDAAVRLMLCDDPQPASSANNFWALALNWTLIVSRCELLGQTSLFAQAADHEKVFSQVVPPAVLLEARRIVKTAAGLWPSKSEFGRVVELSDELLRLFEMALPSLQQPTDQGGQDGGQGAQGSQPGAQGDQGGQDGGQGAQGSQPGAQGGQGGQDAGQDARGSQPGAQGDQGGQDAGQDARGSQPGAQGGQGGQDADQDARGSQPGAQGGQGGQDAGQDARGSQQGAQGSVAGAGASSQSGGTSLGGSKLSEDLPAEAMGDIFGELPAACTSADLTITAMPAVTAQGAAATRVIDQGECRRLLQQSQALRQGLVASLAPMLCGDLEYAENERHGRTLNARQIVRAMCEDQPRVFRKVRIEEDQSVAVQLLIDRSASTNNGVLEAEVMSAFGLASALEQFVEVETAIAYFPASVGQAGSPVLAPLIKPFDTPLRATLGAWPNANGGTPLHDAYQGAALNFLMSQKTRRILIVLTDGKPSGIPEAIERKKLLTQMGVETYGIVINTSDYPEGLFDESLLINSPRELPNALAGLVRRIM